jgi:CheY-like chemotaxis protein
LLGEWKCQFLILIVQQSEHTTTAIALADLLYGRHDIPHFPQSENTRSKNSMPTVLVVDDDPRVTAGLMRALNKHANVISVHDGRQACAIAISLPDLALVVLDVTMPDYDAVDFLRDLREAGRFPPIVLLSGWHKEIIGVVNSFAEAMGFYVSATLEKPCDASVLIDILLNSKTKTVGL